ncbi:MAG: type II secretion system protein GspC [Gammaproteobacteria bacterium]|nr:type II secretion system protein GspC [Gammaproteobacteria bacterium]
MNLAQLQSALPNRLPLVATLIFTVLLGINAAQLSWQFFPTAGTHLSSDKISNNLNRRPQTKTNPARQITPYNLFGSSAKTVSNNRAAPQSVPETRLNITLKGVLAFEPQEFAMAIISQNGRDEQVFSVGNTLPGNAKLKEVYADRIILQRGNRLETLKLPEKGANIHFRQPEKSAQASRILQESQSAKQLRDQIVANPRVLAQMVSTQPVRRGGKLIGYRLKPKQDTGTLEQYGLMPQDIITRVNGVSLNSPKNGLKVLRGLMKAKNIDLMVQRGGVETPVSISLE